ncbi:MAG: helix-turn-helix domain-containing protein [Chloroflexota bacterium]
MNPEKSSNDEREQRILEVASELIAHYGYDKTTVSDIAREAGISKGAIYLHFDSKDALFEALLIREMEAYTMRWMQLLEADERGGTIGVMYRLILQALQESPFMTAMFIRDSRVMGSYIRKPNNFFRRQEEHDGRFIFVKMMQNAGVITEDIDTRVISHVMDMLAFGLVSMRDIKNPAHIPETEALLTGIAEILDRALTPPDADSEAGKQVIRQLMSTAQAQMNE